MPFRLNFRTGITRKWANPSDLVSARSKGTDKSSNRVSKRPLLLRYLILLGWRMLFCMLAHFLHLLDQAPCPFHTLCLNFTEFQYFSSSFLGSRSATASCPASGSASASSSTGTSPILGRADFYLQSILSTSQKGAFQLRSNFLGTGIFASIDKDNLTRGDIISQIDKQKWSWCWWNPPLH